MKNARLITPKYSRIVVRIAERERISLERAVRLYQNAVRFGVSDYSPGLRERVEKAARSTVSFYGRRS